MPAPNSPALSYDRPLWLGAEEQKIRNFLAERQLGSPVCGGAEIFVAHPHEYQHHNYEQDQAPDRVSFTHLLTSSVRYGTTERHALVDWDYCGTVALNQVKAPKIPVPAALAAPGRRCPAARWRSTSSCSGSSTRIAPGGRRTDFVSAPNSDAETLVIAAPP